MDAKNKIKSMRAEAEMTQARFAEYFNIPKRTIEQWEAGERKPPEYVLRMIGYRLVMEGLITKDGDPYEIE